MFLVAKSLNKLIQGPFVPWKDIFERLFWLYYEGYIKGEQGNQKPLGIKQWDQDNERPEACRIESGSGAVMIRNK